MRHNSTTDTPEQGRSCRSFDTEPRANLRNLRKNFRAQDKPSNLSKCIKVAVWQRKERREHAPQQPDRYIRTR